MIFCSSRNQWICQNECSNNARWNPIMDTRFITRRHQFHAPCVFSLFYRNINTHLIGSDFYTYNFIHNFIAELGALSQAGLIAEIKKLYDQAYQLGVEEAREMTRGKYLNIFQNRKKWKYIYASASYVLCYLEEKTWNKFVREGLFSMHFKTHVSLGFNCICYFIYQTAWNIFARIYITFRPVDLLNV